MHPDETLRSSPAIGRPALAGMLAELSSSLGTLTDPDET